jgi:predicted flap endonuclease-1-like 5' DNA nuclease
MGSILSTALVTAPLAFMLGWLLAKAVFRHLSVTRPSPDIAADSYSDTSSASTEIQPKDETKLDLTRSEIQLLKEGLAERDHVIAELKEQLAAKLAPLEDTPANASAQETKLRQSIRAMREGLTTRENQLQELKNRVATGNKKSLQRFRLWRVRFSKAVNQIRQQKIIISELREQLKHRQPAETEQPTDTRTTATPLCQPASAVEGRNFDELRALRGVGPAIQFKLNEQGIYRLQQIADMSMPALLQLGDSLAISRKRMEKADWASQAKMLLNLPAAANQPQAPAEEEVSLAS